MDFPGVSKKQHAGFPEVFVFGLGISKGSNTILWNIQELRFVLFEICRGKVKKFKTQVSFQKSISSTPPPPWKF